MKIAIVEDERKEQEKLKEYLKRYEQEKNVTLDIDVFKDGLDILIDYKPHYDIIFLDIEMVHSNGMETARKIRDRDDNVTIIFVTNMAQYAIQGYSVGAFDFMLKPVRYFDLSSKIDKAITIRKKISREEIVVTVNGSMRRIALADIYYLEVIKHCILFHTVNGEFEVWNQTLNKMEQELGDYSFARCNVSFLVNLRYVNAIEGSTVLVGQDRLQISRTKKKDFMNALTVYLGDKMKL